MNTVILTGRLTAEPEIKHTNNGVEVLSFCIAVKRRYTQADSEITADFINCVAWRHTAEFISKYFKKGDMIAVTGEIQTRKYQDQNENTRTATEVIINHAEFCGNKNTTTNEAEKTAATATGNAGGFTDGFTPFVDEDLPFL